MDEKIYHELIKELEARESVCSATILDGPMAGDKLIYSKGGAAKIRETAVLGEGESLRNWEPFLEAVAGAEETRILQVGEIRLLIEVFMDKPRLVVLGGGHVGACVARLGSDLDFHVTIADDREEFASREKHPGADVVICDDFHNIWDRIPNTPNSYYVIATRGHKADECCALEVLKRDCVYKGMIGSRGKVAATKKIFAEAGFTPEEIAKLHAPIGLPIGGQTPMEIAVSIMAQIIQSRYACFYSVMDADIWREIENPTAERGVMVTITHKEGSSPRGVGSKMLVLPDGRIFGSIGGGTVEYAAICDAKENPVVHERFYDLSNSETAKLGMICGGRVRVLFEPVRLK